MQCRAKWCRTTPSRETQPLAIGTPSGEHASQLVSPAASLPSPFAETMTVSSISQTRTYRTSKTVNSYSNYLSPAERAEQRRKEQADAQAKAMDKNFTREWKKGDIYAPHDLSAAEARKWRKKYTPTIDAFDALSLNPLDFYKVRLSFHPAVTG